jgi:hypothetical protein
MCVWTEVQYTCTHVNGVDVSFEAAILVMTLTRCCTGAVSSAPKVPACTHKLSLWHSALVENRNLNLQKDTL